MRAKRSRDAVLVDKFSRKRQEQAAESELHPSAPPAPRLHQDDTQGEDDQELQVPACALTGFCKYMFTIVCLQ